MHWLDRLSMRWLIREPIFSGGWGDHQPLAQQAERFATPHDAPVLSIQWAEPKRVRGLTVQDGAAPTCTDVLPEALRTVHVRRLLTPREPVMRVVVPPSWNDGGYDQRMFLFGALVAQRIEVWLLEGAYFGARASPITTVESFFRMGMGHVEEIRALVTTALQDRPTGVAGYSMAGQLGASAVQSLPQDVPVVSMAGPPSADVVFVEGPLSRQVEWQQLGDDARARLQETLKKFSVLSQPPPRSKRRAVAVNVADGVVAPEATVRIAVHWDVEPVRVRSGHVGAVVFERRALQRLVAQTLLG